ncbi:MAG: class I SAM-dependent methyltransferase [Clostridia bacterium]|nr:class I SAM-dependent methyltransferase [Clostridia bacterium]
MFEQYTVLPEFYDRLNGEADYKAYAEWLSENIPKGASVLDLGCGTGEISIALSKKGYMITGLDYSSEMLAEASQKAEKNRSDIFFTCQDMTSFSVSHLYDAVVSCFDCLNYLLSKDKLLSAFCRVYTALDNNGLFIFDMNAPAKFEKLYADNTFVIEEDGIFCVWENEYNTRSRRCKFYINIFVENNGAYDRYYEEQCERSYKLSDITECLDKAGFELVSITADFDGASVDEDTERYYFIARKKQ